MAQGRFLSSSVSEDERLNHLSIEGQMMYLMTIPHLDRDGLINGNPSVLLGKVCPLRPKLASRMSHIIDEWVQSGMVVKYANGDGFVLWFKGFAKNNPLTHYLREKASRFPPPPGYARGDKGLIPEAEIVKKATSQSASEASGENQDISGKVPEDSGKNPTHVQARAQAEDQDQVEVEDQVDDHYAASGNALIDDLGTTPERVFDRLAEEWMTVNKTQVDNHNALAGKYGFDAWLAGFDACKRGQRSNQSYVEKAVISAIERNPSLELAKPTPPGERYYYTDPVTGITREVVL